MAKQKNEPTSGGKMNVSVDIKHERFGFIQSTDTIYFEQQPKEDDLQPEVIHQTTVIEGLLMGYNNQILAV